MRRLAVLDDHAAADNGALFPVIGIIGLPVGSAMTCCRKDYACLVGNFGCTGCILKPLVTAVAGVICCVAFLRASRSLCGNEGQIVRMRYGLVISAGVADVIAAVIVSRLVLLFVAARAFFPMIVCVLAPIACPCVPELCTCCSKGFCCADLSAGAALEIYFIVGAVGSRLEGFRLLNFLIVGVGMGNCLVCYNNGFVCVHRNIQDIGKYVCCNAVHSNNVDFIAVIRGKDNRFGGAFGQSGFACGNRSVTAVYLCCEAIGGDRCVLVGRFHADFTVRHYESSGFTVRIFKSSAAAFYYPLIKHLTVRSRICGQSNGCALRRFTDFASCTDCRFAVRYDDGILFTLPDCIEGSIRAYFIGRAGNNRTVGTG